MIPHSKSVSSYRRWLMVGSFKELESPFDPKGNTFYEFMT